VIELHSAAADRTTYLQRPDLGRRLNDASRKKLDEFAEEGARGFDIAFVVADGLSAFAVNEHAPSMLEAVRPMVVEAGLHMAPVALVDQLDHGLDQIETGAKTTRPSPIHRWDRSVHVVAGALT